LLTLLNNYNYITTAANTSTTINSFYLTGSYFGLDWVPEKRT